MTYIDKLLKLDAFKKYLDSVNSDEVVGITGSCKACPIAEYLIDTTGFNWEVLSYECFCLEANSREQDFILPQWVRHFITEVDFNGHLYLTYDSVYITKDIAVRMLDTVEKKIAKLENTAND